jgi:hypothetical protein
MASAAATIPDDQALLCETCGYVLRGLGMESNCPECGTAITQSDPELRRPSAWETATRPSSALGRFMTTTAQVLFRPAQFFRHLAVRHTNERARRFAIYHWCLAALLIGVGAHLHWQWYEGLNPGRQPWFTIGPGTLVIGTLAMLGFTTHIAARLTAWEAAYRGLRLPLPVVLRGMYFHSAHYLPVAMITLATIGGYQLAIHWNILDAYSATTYLYILCGEVVLAAAYLFKTYWIGMRNMMYANR